MFRHINEGIISRCVCIAHFDKWGNQEVMDSHFFIFLFYKFEIEFFLYVLLTRFCAQNLTHAHEQKYLREQSARCVNSLLSHKI